jgi:hypothetical protein
MSKHPSTILAGPLSEKDAETLKNKKYPDSKKGAISAEVMSGQECLDEGIKQ